MSYVFERFDASSGSLVVRVGTDSFAVDVPVQEGKFLTGEDLHTYVRGLIPVWAITRQEQARAATNADEIHALCEQQVFTPTEPSYSELRARAYPSPVEYLDALVKGDQAAIDAYIARCKEIKAMYPKPQVSAAVLKERFGL